MWRRIVGISLILIGLCIISSALYMKYNTAMKQKQMIEEFENGLKNLQEAETSSSSSTAKNDKSSVEVPQAPDATQQLGELIISKINLKVIIEEGTDKKTLKYAVGHFIGTAMPGQQGNFSLAGHRSYTYGQYFNRLDELQLGDEIVVKTTKGQFTYIVSEKKVVEPTDISVLNSTKTSTITLVTCTPIRIATHRLIIKGILK